MADPEARTLQSGMASSKFRVGVSRRRKNESGQTESDFFDITAFGKIAEICNGYVRKGVKVFVRGHMQNRSWEHDGKKYHATELILEDLEMLTPRAQQQGAQNYAPQQGGHAPQQNYQQPPQKPYPAASFAPPPMGGDNDIPF